MCAPFRRHAYDTIMASGIAAIAAIATIAAAITAISRQTWQHPIMDKNSVNAPSVITMAIMLIAAIIAAIMAISRQTWQHPKIAATSIAAIVELTPKTLKGYQ